MLRLSKLVHSVKFVVNPAGFRRFSVDKGEFVAGHLHYIKMPPVMDAKEGVVDKWLKREGESFKSGESLCEVSISGFSLAIDQPTHGIVAEIIANDGKTVDTDHPIASFVLNTEEYLEFVEAKRLLVEDSERMESTKEVQDEKTKKPDTMVLMREIKHLIQHGEIEEGSDFAKKLQSQARKGNPELMSVFVASFDGSSFNTDTFDVKFFIDNAKEVIDEAEAAKKE